MLRNIQNVDSAIQLHCGDTAVMSMAGDSAHCVQANPCLGTWQSYSGASGKQSPGLLGCNPTAGTRRSFSYRESGEQLSRRLVVGIEPTRTRTAGDPPAPIWAALVIQRAVTT